MEFIRCLLSRGVVDFAAVVEEKLNGVAPDVGLGRSRLEAALPEETVTGNKGSFGEERGELLVSLVNGRITAKGTLTLPAPVHPAELSQ